MKMFVLEGLELERYEAWLAKQSKVCHRAGGDAGVGPIEFIIRPGYIGTSVSVRNVYTGDVEDLTDYDSW